MAKRREPKVRFEGVFNAAPGDHILFTRDQAAGAIPNGSLIEKCNSEPGDAHGDGAPGHVLGSMGPFDDTYGYFIEWLDKPNTPVFIKGSRIRKVVEVRRP